ncbi:glucose dehydrogenase [Halopseudomonas pachastrellae]|uniref:Glucose dehydrogenase n=1 Tax=Halopseudomonas pachastrellae TaxID=254161 RepID=A0A1S8DIP4_9GAMM|nr:PQQ-dependent sugar dehydrogenase [Halopseudomonas pachastrellae]ONM44686.1 glucose dehydrogenase [Halopseudomonas pachastrellae]SFM29722.1 Glucose/arabinose dehydrogenase, beta-propeller fold [Halopseudomonas pachastrellae]
MNKTTLLGTSLLLCAGAATAADYQVETLADGLSNPWSLAFLPDGGMLVTERSGQLRLIDAAGQLRAEPVAGVPEAFVNGQSGLMEVALAPDFAESGELFLSYSCGTREANHTCLAAATFNGEALENTHEIFRVQPAKKGSAHYGGRIAFLPDNTLLLTLGDGFDYREQAQNTANHLGSIVRLNRDGSAPEDNPFVGQADAMPELYSIGHRNVQGILVDDAGRVFSHEHGPRGGDEINLIEAGKNYGWPKITYGIDYNGSQISPYTELPGLEQPLVYWDPSIAPSGMTLYQGELFPEWQGSLLVSALAGKEVRRVELKGNAAGEQESLFTELGERFRDVRTGPDGAVYLLTDSPSGQLLRVVPAN